MPDQTSDPTGEPLRALIERELPDIVTIRRDLHRHPELMFQEHRTSDVVRRELDALDIPYRAGLAGGTGVVAYLPSTRPPGKAGPSIALRADMDALPITEQSGAEYASENEGVMHACGHDGHTATLLGAMRVLARTLDRPNPVTLIFQPAEEGGRGGARMVEDGALAGGAEIEGIGGAMPRIDRIYGLHGWPTLPRGHIATRAGTLLAAVAMFDAQIIGKGGHAALPERTRDPVLAAAHAVTALQGIVARMVDPLDAAVVSVTSIDAGAAKNVIPERVSLRGTLRALTDERLADVSERVAHILHSTAHAFDCRATYTPEFVSPATENDAVEAERVLRLARSAYGAEQVHIVERPTMGGEDFAFYGREAKACFFLLGLCPPGEDPMARPQLHQPDFDFDDGAIAAGIEMFCRLALEPESSLQGGPSER